MTPLGSPPAIHTTEVKAASEASAACGLVACVFNEHDPVTRTLVERADVQDGCRAVGFTTDTPGLSDVGVVDGILVDRAFLDNRRHEAIALAELRTRIGDLRGGAALDALAARVVAGETDPYRAADELVARL